MTPRTACPAAIGAAVLLGSVVAAAPAQARGANFTEETGGCSHASSWVMKAKPDTGRIELELSVESQRAGQTWSVRIRRDGALVYSGKRVTNRISHSFSVDRRLANGAGADRFVGRATNARTGEVCRSHVVLRAAGSGSGPG